MDELPRIAQSRLDELRRLAKDYPRTALIKAFCEGQLSVKASGNTSDIQDTSPLSPL